MMSQVPLKATVDLIGSGYKRKYDERFKIFESTVGIGRLLPRGARLVLHEEGPHLGVGVPTVSDSPLFQAALVYGTMSGPRQAYETLRGMGVTHVAWRKGTSRGADSLAGDLLFFDFVARHTGRASTVSGWTVAPLLDRPERPADPPNDVLYLGCTAGYRQGIYHLADLAIPGQGRRVRFPYPPPRVELRDPDEVARSLGAVRYVVHDPKCVKELPFGLTERFERAVQRKRQGDLWILKTVTGTSVEAPAGRPPSEPGIGPGREPDVTRAGDEGFDPTYAPDL
jgi:hypothetical protein